MVAEDKLVWTVGLGLPGAFLLLTAIAIFRTSDRRRGSPGRARPIARSELSRVVAESVAGLKIEISGPGHPSALHQLLQQERKRGRRVKGGGYNIEDFHTKVVGVTFGNDDGTPRQRIIKRCRVRDTVFLVRDPHNAYDSSAVRVVRENGEMIGHLSAFRAEQIAPYLDKGWVYRATISSRTGGWFRARGVNLRIRRLAEGSPEEAKMREAALAVASTQRLTEPRRRRGRSVR